MAFRLNRVLITENIDPSCEEILKAAGIEVVTKTGLNRPQLFEEIAGDYDGLIVRSATKVTADLIHVGKHLSVIGRAGTGVDNIDCKAATENGILVLNAPSGNTLSAAELTCGMIVTLSRNIPQACASMKNKEWDRKGFMGTELYGKTLAILGLGRIGREVAQRMQAFGMKTIGFDPLVPADVSETFGVESCTLKEIWPLADYITIHTPLIPQTTNLIDDEVFSKCKRGVKIVNCARGGIVDEAALLRALNAGECSGAGLDAFAEEPPMDWALVKHPKVICTPHLGASTVEAQKRVAVEVAEQFVKLRNGECVAGVVNSPTFSEAFERETRPWVELCQALGHVLATLVSDVPADGVGVTVALQGDEIAKKGKILEVAALVGLLQGFKFSDVNFVNAQSKAKLPNIRTFFAECLDIRDPPPNVARLMLGAGATARSVVGTVYGDEPYLLAIDNKKFEVAPKLAGSVILCRSAINEGLIPKLLEAVVKSGEGFGIQCTPVFNEQQSWYVMNSHCLVEGVPNSIKDSIDFWAQLAL